MKITKILLPSAVVATTALFVLPSEQTQAFTTIGGSLGTSQRDYRVWNNFSDVKSNNNTIANPDFPGSFGAIMAVRKGGAEWNSDPHGNSPYGSGGANFDFWYAGEANAAGGFNSNILSVLSGSSGSTLAFMQGPISNGWTIKFYDGGIVWTDGPSNIGNQVFDIQSVACHELGHALGLGHTNVGGSTMTPSVAPGSTGNRTIGPDDVAGVQFIYGSKSGNKPRIDDVAVANGVATITGANFSNNGNEVWFTEEFPASSNGIQISNVSSTNGGTQITINIPANADSGDVIVKNSGSGGSSLSNTWPIDVDGQGSTPPTFYCVGKFSSAFCLAQLTTSDPNAQPVSGANDYDLIANGVQELKNGLFFGSISGPDNTPFSGGTLCVSPPTFRTPIQNSGGVDPNGCNGQMVLTVNTGVLIPFGPDAGPGNMSWMQLWYRDPNNGAGNLGTALSDAVEFTFQ